MFSRNIATYWTLIFAYNEVNREIHMYTLAEIALPAVPIQKSSSCIGIHSPAPWVMSINYLAGANKEHQIATGSSTGGFM